MSSLTWLKASKTKMKNIPESVTKLNKLEDLILCRNEIDELPQQITEMTGLRVCIQNVHCTFDAGVLLWILYCSNCICLHIIHN